jgi:hypothetical protein
MNSRCLSRGGTDGGGGGSGACCCCTFVLGASLLSLGVLVASARAYLPQYQPSIALSASGLQLLDQPRLVEDLEDPSLLVVVIVVV